jgi:hypothetical protein
VTPFSLILSLLEKLPPLLSATSRLVKAVKDSEPPVPMEQGADAYLRGANDQAFRQSQRERLRWVLKDQADEKVEAERPSDD